MSSRPKIACLCCTYMRPHLLGESIECFLRQDYPAERRELIVLDDAGQYEEQEGDGWRIVSIARRFRTLGEKRNASAALASPDVEAYAVWDDDDIYLPWHLTTMAHALGERDWSRPGRVWFDRRDHLELYETDGLFHPSWGFTRGLFERTGGYPWIQSGQDQGLAARIRYLGVPAADPCKFGRPSFIYRWFTTPRAWHLSAMGDGGYEKLGDWRHRGPRIARVRPEWSRDWLELVNQPLNRS